MTISLRFQHETLLLDPAGAVFWPGQRLLVLADLHFEKASAAAMKGSLLPPFDTHATLEKLEKLIQHYTPARLLLLGDSFHDSGGWLRLNPADRAQLHRLARDTEFIWLTGNHDRALTDLPGQVWPDWRQGVFTFRHIAEARAEAGEISGHFHPKASIVTKARNISRPCFAVDGTRLILPAFGAYTGGLDVRAPAIAGLFPKGLQVFLLSKERLFSFSLPPQ